MAGIAALAAAYVLSQFYRSFLAVLTPALTTEIGMSKAELSLASGAWFVVFGLAQFVIGVSLDRYGPKLTAAVLLALCGGGGALLFAVAVTPMMVIVAMALIGAGCAPIMVASIFIFARSFRPARLAVLTSWFMGVGSAGNVIGATPMAAAAEMFGWREVMAALAVITVVVAAAMLFLVRDPEKTGAEGDVGFSGYLDLIKVKALWPLLPIAALNYAPTAGIRGLWAGPFLSDVYGADALMIGQITLFMALAMVAGSFVYGPLDTIFKTRKWVAVTGNCLSVLAILALAFFPLAGIPQVTVTLILIGVCGGGYGLIMAHGRAFLPAHLTGRGVTLLNFFSIGGVGVMQFVTGGVVTAATVPDEPAAAYTTLFFFYAAMLVAAILVYLFSRDARPEEGAAPAAATAGRRPTP